MKNMFLYIINSELQFVPGPRPIPVPVPLNGDIDMFSELGIRRTQGTPYREWLVLPKRCNAANDCFPARPEGVKQMLQSGVTVLNKDMPLIAVCALSWNIRFALIMPIPPFKSTRCPGTFGFALPSIHGMAMDFSPVHRPVAPERRHYSGSRCKIRANGVV